MISKHPLADCENCPLATQPYYSQPLNEDAAVVFVGSGPVLNEGFKGGFLYGADAGKLIRSVCNVHNIPIENVTYTTAVKCAGLADLKLSDKRKAMAACNPAMFDDLDKVDPDAVVTLGGEAYTATTGVRSSVSNARVGPAKYSDATQTMVVPTVSPWACLQTESQFQFLVTDIGKLVNKAPEFTPPVYDVIYTEHEGRSVLTGWIKEAEAIDERQPLVLDIEVAMEKDISFEHPSRYDMLCIGVKYGDHTITVFTEDSLSPEFWELFRLLCDNSEVVAHNGKFDLSGLRHLCGKINLNFDTMLAHYVLDERSGIHGLKYLAQEYLGAPAYDDEITAIMGKSKDFGTIPKDTLYKYNAYDVHCTALLHTMFKKRLQDDKLQHVHDFLIKVSNMLQDVEHVGMAIDRKYLGELDYEYVNKMDSQIEALKDFVGPDFNPRSYQQVKKFLLDCGIEVASTAANVLEGVVSRIEELFEENRGNLPAKVRIGYGMLTTLLEYRKDQKLYGTYVEGTKNRLYRGKVHPTYLIHGTTTGRLSARNPNTQNISSDKKIKRLFIPSAEDRSLVHADYSQAELRYLSYFAKDTYFRDIFNDGSRDLFDELIVEIFPGSIKELESPADWKHKRRVVKTVVYGLNYGRTEYGIAQGLDIPVDEALKIKNRFFSTIPEIIGWQEEIKEAVRRGDDLVTPFGRHRRYSLITRQNEKKVMNEALAFMPQSTASDGTVQAAVLVNKEFNAVWGRDPKRPHIINLVHDDIIVDASDDDAEEVGEILSRNMIEVAERCVNGYVKFDVAANAGKSWDELL